jgi:2-dehydropantoate 2-reductase
MVRVPLLFLMKIAVVGCGALGSFYGAKLCVAGAEAHFLLRSDYEAVRRAGVRIQSISGDFRAWPECARDPQDIGRCDLVLIGLKTTANSEFGRLLPPLVGRATSVVTLQNGLGNEERLAELFGPDRILGGLCFVCLNRIAPGVIQHIAYGDVALGEFQRPAQARTCRYAKLFRQSGVPCELTDDLAKARWEKLVWNVPFNGLGVAGAAGYEAVLKGELEPQSKLGPCLSTDLLLGDPRWAELARELMREVIRAAAQHGFDIPESVIEDRLQRTRRMGAYKASTLIDFEHGQALEVDSLFREPLRRAQAAGVPTPRLAALCGVLSALEAGKRVAVG